MIQKSNKPNRQVQRTKSWIFEALMLLIEKMPYNKITVSDICEKAGIARPTFYRNYKDKDDIAREYLLNVFSTELLNIEEIKKDDKQNTIVLMLDYRYMISNQKNLKKILSNVDMVKHIYHEGQMFPISFLEHYKKKLSTEEYLICRYKLCYQITGCLMVFFDWFINDIPISVENIVLMLNAMNIPKTIQYRNIPSIVVRMKDE
jgi:predicted transcriptional regulator